MRKTLLATTFVLMSLGTAQAAPVEIPKQRFDLSITDSASFANDSNKLAFIIEKFGGRIDRGAVPSNPITELFKVNGDAGSSNLSSVPVPAAIWLLAPALGLFASHRRKMKA